MADPEADVDVDAEWRRVLGRVRRHRRRRRRGLLLASLAAGSTVVGIGSSMLPSDDEAQDVVATEPEARPAFTAPTAPTAPTTTTTSSPSVPPGPGPGEWLTLAEFPGAQSVSAVGELTFRLVDLDGTVVEVVAGPTLGERLGGYRLVLRAELNCQDGCGYGEVTATPGRRTFDAPPQRTFEVPGRPPVELVNNPAFVFLVFRTTSWTVSVSTHGIAEPDLELWASSIDPVETADGWLELQLEPPLEKGPRGSLGLEGARSSVDIQPGTGCVSGADHPPDPLEGGSTSYAGRCFPGVGSVQLQGTDEDVRALYDDLVVRLPSS